MDINPFTTSELRAIIDKGRYPAYDAETEERRMRRMDSRLEWRRRKRWVATKNRLAMIATWYAAGVAIVVGIVLFSELLRLATWTILR